MKTICDETKCSGCYACFNICPKDAIEMSDFGLDGIKPIINKEKCINCHLCEKNCPVNSNKCYDFNLPMKAYAYKSNQKYSNLSSSGGAAYTMYNEFINQKGVVYGANNIENGEFKFIRITEKKDLHKLQGSKYVHCHIGKVFSLIKKDLLAQKKVLFIGTPCQVAGLLTFLKSEYANLYTVDLICHGVPSQSILFNSINYKQDYLSKANKISFRDGTKYILNVYHNDEVLFSYKCYYRNVQKRSYKNVQNM